MQSDPEPEALEPVQHGRAWDAWAILVWTAAIVVSGIVIEFQISGSLTGGCDYETEGSLNCAGADAAGSLLEWILEGGFFLAWVVVWFLGFEAIRFLGRRSDRGVPVSESPPESRSWPRTP